MGMNSGHREHQGFFVRKGNLNSDARHSTESGMLLPDSNSFVAIVVLPSHSQLTVNPWGFQEKRC